MVLSDICIKRPVFATVISLLLVTFGVISYLRLPLREFPDIDTPIVSVSTSYTGASASVKGYAQSAPFAMAKFALRGLAQSMARELQSKNIHIAHFVIDGGVASAARGRTTPADAPDSLLHADAIADTYLAVLKQHRSAWSLEVELRPWVERF